MRDIKRHFKRGKKLDRQKKGLEARLEQKIGQWVAINYNNYHDIYNFQTNDYIGVIELSDLLGIKGNIKHVITGDENYPNELVVEETYNGQAIKVFCIATDKEYREGFAKHERTTSKNN